MKAVIFVVCLVLSLPNLLAGFALLVVQRTFRTRDILDIVLHFFQSILWGVPIAAGVLLLLLLAGIITESRPYAALCSLLLNLVALGLVVFRMGPLQDASQAIFFLPVLLALAGFGWIAFARWQGVQEM